MLTVHAKLVKYSKSTYVLLHLGKSPLATFYGRPQKVANSDLPVNILQVLRGMYFKTLWATFHGLTVVSLYLGHNNFYIKKA